MDKQGDGKSQKPFGFIGISAWRSPAGITTPKSRSQKPFGFIGISAREVIADEEEGGAK